MSSVLRSEASSTAAAVSLAAEVRRYLSMTPRQLPSRALYDTLGSALFDAICHLPWYPVTRAERRLIASARRAIVTAAGSPHRLVELGCGNGEKLALLLGPREEPSAPALHRVDLVDVSASALSAASRLIKETHEIAVVLHQQPYEDGLRAAAAARPPVERLGVLFLGSNLGNFDPPGSLRFLQTVRQALAAGDTLVIGVDLVKPAPVLLAAYDDPLGVTAAFNKNLLVRLNREMGATFDIAAFDHRAVWNAGASRVEMHLVSGRRQRVDVPAAGVTIDLQPGETIWTESSYKYDRAGIAMLLRRAGFTIGDEWVDEEGQFLLLVACTR